MGAYIGGLIIAVAVLLVALTVTIMGYLAYCSAHPSKRGAARAAVLVAVFVVSLVVRLYIGVNSLENKDISGGAASAFHGILSAIAGLLLDSPADIDFSVASGVAVCLYHGVTAYAALVFVIIITVGVSYEIYSRVSLFFKRIGLGKKVYYVFTAVTNDAIVLAKSIKEEHLKNGRTMGKSVIIFYNSDDEPFSRKNPLHCAIIENGFYFVSGNLRDDKGEPSPILKDLKLRNLKRYDKKELRNKIVHVFAMDDRGNYEGNNADAVFDDFKATLMTYVFKRRRKKEAGANLYTVKYRLPTAVNYHLLTGGEINFESYERRKKAIWNECLKSSDGNLEPVWEWFYKIRLKQLNARKKQLNKDLRCEKSVEMQAKIQKELEEVQTSINGEAAACAGRQKRKRFDAIKKALIENISAAELTGGNKEDIKVKLRELKELVGKDTARLQDIEKEFAGIIDRGSVTDDDKIRVTIIFKKLVNAIKDHTFDYNDLITKCENPERGRSAEELVLARLQINVFNEATLSSSNLIEKRNKNLTALCGKRGGVNAFEEDCKPVDGAYRVAVIGFGKTGQYAMKELYTHTAYLDGNNAPSQFIADVFDAKIDEKSGLFAYNHPLFRCLLNDKTDDGKPTLGTVDKLKSEALKVNSEAVSNLRAAYPAIVEKIGWELRQLNAKLKDTNLSEADKTKLGQERAVKENLLKSANAVTDIDKFIEDEIAFPIVVFHKNNSFEYPFTGETGSEAFVSEIIGRKIRDVVISLGDDERNVAMANALIDSLRRHYLKAKAYGKNQLQPHVTVYVNIIDVNNRELLNWRWSEHGGINDIELYNRPYDSGNTPMLSVVPFGYREEMYSYATLIEDYRERIYNYAYDLYASTNEIAYGGFTDAQKEAAEDRINEKIKALNELLGDKKTFGAFRALDYVSDDWLYMSAFMRLSNKSARQFAINYYVKKDDYDMRRLKRLEHERWNRFYISHGWNYALYENPVEDMTKRVKTEWGIADKPFASRAEKERIEDKIVEEVERRLQREAAVNTLCGKSKGEIKNMHRSVKEHNCLCPYDIMLDKTTKSYDENNVSLGMLECMVIE